MRPSQRDIVAELRMDANDHREASWHDGSGSVITANIESDAATEIESLRARIKTLEEALQFYADEKTWQQMYETVPYGSTTAQMPIGCHADEDLGETARAALKGDV